MTAKLAVLLFATAAAAVSTPTALPAQDRDVERGDRIDYRMDRLADPQLDEALRSARSDRAATGPATALTFSLSVPGAWTNNADYADTGGRSDFHVNPTAQIALKHDTGSGIVFDARATASSDQYLRHEDNNSSFLRLRLQASLPKALGGFTPYARYQPRINYGDGEFGGDSVTTHDFTLGASGPVGSSAKLELFGMRREASASASERWQAGGSLTFNGNLMPDKLGWSLSQGLEGRFYTGGTNDGRHDLYAITTAGLTMTVADQVEITPVEISAEWNQSNRANRDYFVVSIGLGISFSFSTR